MHILMWVDGPPWAICMKKRGAQIWPVLHCAACQYSCAAASLLTQNQTVAPTSGNLASIMILTPMHLKAHRTLSLQQKINLRQYTHSLFPSNKKHRISQVPPPTSQIKNHMYDNIIYLIHELFFTILGIYFSSDMMKDLFKIQNI